jgi:biopolymer transport protein ExbD
MKVRPYTRPFDLQRFVEKTPHHWDFIPFVDLCLMGLFFALTFSRFVFAPGVSVDLPKVHGSDLTGSATVAVLTVLPLPQLKDASGNFTDPLTDGEPQGNLVVFDGEIFRVKFLEKKFSNYLKNSKVKDAVLLVKAHRHVELEEILQIFHMAQAGGFSAVQLAAQEEERELEFISVE